MLAKFSPPLPILKPAPKRDNSELFLPEMMPRLVQDGGPNTWRFIIHRNVATCHLHPTKPLHTGIILIESSRGRSPEINSGLLVTWCDGWACSSRSMARFVTHSMPRFTDLSSLQWLMRQTRRIKATRKEGQLLN